MTLLKTLPLIAAGVLLAACGSGTDSGSSSGSGSTPSSSATTAAVAAIASAVPAEFSDGVTAAVYTDWAPEEYVEGSDVKGWAVDMATEMSQKMGVKFTYKPSGFDAIIPGLGNGRFDMAIASLGVTPDRLSTVDFIPLQKEGTAFAWKKGEDSEAVSSIDDVCGKTVAVLTGAYEYDYLTQHNSELCGDDAIKLEQFKDQPSAELAVASGRVDLVAAGSGKLGYAAKQSGQLEVGTFIVGAVYNGLGVPKDSPLGPVLKDALQSMIDDGSYAKLRRQYGASEAGDLTKAVLVTEANPEG